MYLSQRGVLRVTVISGSLENSFPNLKPYIISTIGNQSFNSQTGSGYLPHWNFSQNFRITKEISLNIRILNKTTQKDMFLGLVIIDIKNIRFSKRLAGEYPVYLDNKRTGAVTVLLEYDFMDSQSVISGSNTPRGAINFARSNPQSIQKSESRDTLVLTPELRLPEIKPSKIEPETTPNIVHLESIQVQEENKLYTKIEGDHDRLLPLKLIDLSMDKIISKKGENITYDGKIKEKNIEVIIKIKTFKKAEDFENFHSQQLKFSKITTPSIVKIVSLIQDKSKLTSYCVLEKLKGIKLQDFLSNLVDKHLIIPEEKLYCYYKSIVSLFLLLKEEGINHNDINVNCLYLTSNSLCLTKFGLLSESHTNYFEYVRNHAIHVSSPYFSPSVLKAYLNYLKTSSLHMAYDPEKSDVYSLGLTFLHMASLVPPCGLNDITNDLESRISKIVESLPYSTKIKSILTMMLELNENQRPDFKSLHELI